MMLAGIGSRAKMFESKCPNCGCKTTSLIKHDRTKQIDIKGIGRFLSFVYGVCSDCAKVHSY